MHSCANTAIKGCSNCWPNFWANLASFSPRQRRWHQTCLGGTPRGGRTGRSASLAMGREAIITHPCIFSIKNPEGNIQGGGCVTLQPVAELAPRPGGLGALRRHLAAGRVCHQVLMFICTCKRERRQVGPEVGPTSAFYSCIPTIMCGPTCIFWANLTPFSLTVKMGT
jgi:hypothetical protein